MKSTQILTPVIALSLVSSLAADVEQTNTVDLVAGPPEKCIQVSLIDHTSIIDNENIIFYLKGGRMFRNILPVSCGGLDPNQVFRYETATSQLCNVDAITVLVRAGSEFLSGPSCALGLFYPVSAEDVAGLKARAQSAQEK